MVPEFRKNQLNAGGPRREVASIKEKRRYSFGFTGLSPLMYFTGESVLILFMRSVILG